MFFQFGGKVSLLFKIITKNNNNNNKKWKEIQCQSYKDIDIGSTQSYTALLVVFQLLVFRVRWTYLVHIKKCPSLTILSNLLTRDAFHRNC